ncbi:MAG: hypothetical protein GY757_17535, partial [bacterium]|nr:hypothetical protein [bacterium]
GVYLRDFKNGKSPWFGAITGGYTAWYIADFDNDGILESKYNAFGILASDNQSDKLSYFYHLLKSRSKKSAIPPTLRTLIAAWKQFLRYPSKKNIRFLYKNLPINRPDTESPIEKKIWLWIWQSLKTLENEVYAGERDAVRVAFRLLTLAKEAQTPNLDKIITHLIRIHPVIFLEILKEFKKEIKPEYALDDSVGYAFSGLREHRLLKLKKTYDALKGVKKKKLLDIRDYCLDYLSWQIDFIKKNSDSQ